MPRRYPPDERAAEHLRNALAMLQLAMQTGTVTMGNEGAGVVVPMGTLGAVAARIEAALDQLEPPPTILPFPQPPEDQ